MQAISIGVDDMQRGFEPLIRQVDRWRGSQLNDTAAKMLIYRTFVEAEIDLPHHLDRTVHSLLFQPTASGIPTPDALEFEQQLHLRIQGVGARPAIPGHCRAWGIPQRALPRGLYGYPRRDVPELQEKDAGGTRNVFELRQTEGHMPAA